MNTDRLNGARTVQEMQPAIGAAVLVQFESLSVRCIVSDAKSAYGRVRIQVQPESGQGSQWVELSRIRPSLNPEDAADVAAQLKHIEAHN
jgi:hypothetical protein